MKPRKYTSAITFALDQSQRMAVEALAEKENKSLGEAARDLLNIGIQARGLAV